MPFKTAVFFSAFLVASLFIFGRSYFVKALGKLCNLNFFLLDAMTFGGHRPPSLEPKYEVTVKDKMLYHAITVQPAYENYSFEELRYASPALQRQSETMLVSQKSQKTTEFKLFSIQKLRNSTLTKRCLGSR